MNKLTSEYIGSLSWGTMRAEDLIPTFMSFLQDHADECDVRNEVDKTQGEVDELKYENHEGYGRYYADDDKDEWGQSSAERASWILSESIWDLLNEIAPEHCSFGASEGDGADYGFQFYCSECGMQISPEEPCWFCDWDARKEAESESAHYGSGADDVPYD